MTTNKFADSHSEFLYHATHAFVKLFKIPPFKQPHSHNCIHLVKIGHHALIVMATILSKHEILLFSKLTLMQVIKLNDIERVGVRMYTFKHFIIQLSNMSHTWPRNPHDCG